MSKTRIKVAPTPILTRQQMEQAVARVAELKVAEQAAVARLNQEIEIAKRNSAPFLDGIATEIDAKSQAIREWAEANPADFGKLRSIDLVHAVIGWRNGMPALKTLKGWTWDRVLDVLCKAAQLDYVRQSMEVNKQALLDNRDTLGEVGLRQFGVEVRQVDSFYIDAKIVQPEKREVA